PAARALVFTKSPPAGSSLPTPTRERRGGCRFSARLGLGTAEGSGDLVDRRPLGLADARSTLPVRVGDLLGEREDEASVALDLVRRGLALEQLDGVLQMLQAVLPQLLDRVVARVVDLGLRRDDLVEQLALAVLLARLDVRLGDRERLAARSSALGGDDDHARARGSLQPE